jgi:hypothetical protein
LPTGIYERTEKHLQILEDARERVVRKPLNEETKRKIGIANNGNFYGTCDYCGKQYHTIKSHYSRSRRHFCCTDCHSGYRKNIIPKEEHARFGKGMSQEERGKRIKARSSLNHYLRDNHLDRKPCEICGEIAEAHHDDYSKPLDVKWLCFSHHRQHHYSNPELLKGGQDNDTTL